MDAFFSNIPHWHGGTRFPQPQSILFHLSYMFSLILLQWWGQEVVVILMNPNTQASTGPVISGRHFSNTKLYQVNEKLSLWGCWRFWDYGPTISYWIRRSIWIYDNSRCCSGGSLFGLPNLRVFLTFLSNSSDYPQTLLYLQSLGQLLQINKNMHWHVLFFTLVVNLTQRFFLNSLNQIME